MAEDTLQDLKAELAGQLPRDHKFIIHHISTPPTKCDPIYSPPPNTRPDRTYRESQFLQISLPIGADGTPVFILAIECLIYTTRYLTTIFVSKADSTGYVANVQLGKEFESPLRSIATTFVGYLIKHRTRPGTRLVVDLFARASDQYLYPGSVENAQKHVSDDRQLIKWWCRVLDPILQSYAPKPQTKGLFDSAKDAEKYGGKTSAQAYLLVPGEDTIIPFLPPLVRLSPQARLRWTHGHPLSSLSRHAGAPPRCLIPHFPDDPKGRYLVELDDELPDASSQTVGSLEASPSKRGNGEWKSVRSLDRFWEMMAFRSECSSGRLVGFIWLVFEPAGSTTENEVMQASQESLVSSSITTTLQSSLSTPAKKKKSHNRQQKKGRIPALLPRILRSTTSRFDDIPTQTPWFIWPHASRARLVLSDNAYTKATEVLLRLDFANLTVATQSTLAWISEVAVLAGVDADWGDDITGRAAPRQTSVGPAGPADGSIGTTSGNAAVVNVMMGVKRKRPEPTTETNRSNGVEPAASVMEVAVDAVPVVNVLGVRKKPKKVQPMSVTSI